MPLRRWRQPALLVLAAALLLPEGARGHATALDEYGCHAAAKGEGYHCHQGSFAGRRFGSRTEMLAARLDSYTAYPADGAIERFSGQVTAVTAGDELSLLVSGRTRRVRLTEVHCPTKSQPFGKQAKRLTWFLVSNRDVLVTVFGREPRGRLVGEVRLPDGRELSRELIREGLCWWDRRRGKNHALAEVEVFARAEKRGLWADPRIRSPFER